MRLFAAIFKDGNDGAIIVGNLDGFYAGVGDAMSRADFFTMEGGNVGIYVYKPDGTMARKIGDASMTGIHGLCINDENGEQFLYGAHLSHQRAIKVKPTNPAEIDALMKADAYTKHIAQ